MSNVLIDRQKIDILANAISDKSGVPVTMTLDEMVEAVDGIETGGGEPNLQSKTYTVSAAGTETIEADSGYDGLSEVEVTVPLADPFIGASKGYITDGGIRKWRVTPYVDIEFDADSGYIARGTYNGNNSTYNAIPTGTSVTPSTSAQTIGGANYMMEGAVTVAAMPTGTVGTPTATKGTVSNHQVSVTPSVTNTTGYISGGTKNGTAVTVSASELVSGTYTVDSSGTKDVTNYASASVPAGTAGTPSASKGAVSNHSVSVTPSVTNQTGWITGSTKTGTAVTVSASELVSGSETKTSNGTYDVTNLASLVVNVSGGTSKNVQVVQGTTRTNASTLTAIGSALTVSKTGTYDVYWSGMRSNTSSSYTWATQLYVGGSAYGSENTTWTNNVQNNHLSNVSLTANQQIRVYGRNTRGTSYYIYAPTLVIIEA